ncbi:MAG: hypothetical protein HFF13_11050 [Angelakisella sp.]|jgi:hypothetical protein|nr:hypothetical protein [Angelakisella sp.]
MKRILSLLLALFLLLLSGCKEKPDLSGLPELELLEEDGEEYILLEGTRYNLLPFEVIGSGNSGRWDLRAQSGRRVAVLGADTIFTVQGDPEEIFLYNLPENFRFGGVYRHRFLREDRDLVLPDSAAAFDRGTIRTYASGGLFGKKPVTTCEFTDEALLAAIFGAWAGSIETPPVPEGLDRDQREGRALELWSKEYPWLSFHLSCTCYPGGVMLFTGRDGGTVCLPAEVAEQLTWEEPGLWQRLIGGGAS